MREAIREMRDDLLEATFVAAAVGVLLAAIFVWCGWYTGAL